MRVFCVSKYIVHCAHHCPYMSRFAKVMKFGSLLDVASWEKIAENCFSAKWKIQRSSGDGRFHTHACMKSWTSSDDKNLCCSLFHETDGEKYANKNNFGQILHFLDFYASIRERDSEICRTIWVKAKISNSGSSESIKSIVRSCKCNLKLFKKKMSMLRNRLNTFHCAFTNLTFFWAKSLNLYGRAIKMLWIGHPWSLSLFWPESTKHIYDQIWIVKWSLPNIDSPLKVSIFIDCHIKFYSN